MRRSSRSLLGCWVLTVFALWLTPLAARAQTGQPLYDLVEQGRLALVEDKYGDSLAALRKAMARPDFVSSDPGLQYFTYYLASFAAAGVDDDKAAHEYALSATRFPDANGDTWIRAAGTAATLDQWDSAAQALTTIARKYPKTLGADPYNSRLVSGVVRGLGKNPESRQQRLDLLNALYEADFKYEYDTAPSWMWQILVTDALERKDMKRAREVARRIDDTDTLLNMRVDKRYDVLTSEEPKAFDLAAAAERNARRLKKAMNDNPKSLGPAVQYCYALHTQGRFEEMLTLSDGIIAKVEKAGAKQDVYEDLDELNWIHNMKATALRALGKSEEAAAVLAAWEDNPRNKSDSVSQAINLGFFYNELGRPNDALQAVNRMNDKDVSDYGRVQFQFVRFQAYQQLGKSDDARQVTAWLLEHKDDDMETAQNTLLESGDADGAAALLISRLKDPEQRSQVLAEIQVYAQTPRTERQKKLDAEREALLTRPDVVSAIGEYGRREKQPIYSLEY